MFKFLATLMALIERVFAHFDQQHWKQQGRQEATKEMEDVVNRQVELGEAAVAVPDPERDERLRSRFDRSRTRGGE
jgi:predicted component of type VI protein secretion system